MALKHIYAFFTKALSLSSLSYVTWSIIFVFLFLFFSTFLSWWYLYLKRLMLPVSRQKAILRQERRKQHLNLRSTGEVNTYVPYYLRKLRIPRPISSYIC
jgi:hypothetical protein